MAQARVGPGRGKTVLITSKYNKRQRHIQPKTGYAFGVSSFLTIKVHTTYIRLIDNRKIGKFRHQIKHNQHIGIRAEIGAQQFKHAGFPFLHRNLSHVEQTRYLLILKPLFKIKTEYLLILLRQPLYGGKKRVKSLLTHKPIRVVMFDFLTRLRITHK